MSNNTVIWGVVAENNIPGKDKDILVFLTDMFPNATGKLETNPETFKVSGIDATGKHYQIEQKTDTTITATYLNRNNHSITAPLVQKGERVLIHRFANDPTYYWETANLDQNKRVNEVFVEAWAAKNPKSNMPYTPTTSENSYSRTVDTINGIMEEKTSKSNGEVCVWTEQKDGKKGLYTFTDGMGNVIQIDHLESTITLANADGSYVILNRKNIKINAPDKIEIFADNSIEIKTKSLSIETEDTIFKAPNFKLSSDTVDWSVGGKFTMNCPTIELNGMVKVGGLATTGAGGGGGNASIKGSVDITGSQSVGGTLSVAGPVNLNGGTSSGVIAGSYIDT